MDGSELTWLERQVEEEGECGRVLPVLAVDTTRPSSCTCVRLCVCVRVCVRVRVCVCVCVDRQDAQSQNGCAVVLYVATQVL